MKASKIIKGLRNPYRVYLHFIKKPFVWIDRYFNYGTNVFNRTWDLLIVLDSCRYDLFAEFAPRHSVYESLDSVDWIYSIASKSDDWIQRTFEQSDEAHLQRTIYVSDEDHTRMVTTNKLQAVRSIPGDDDNTEAGVMRPEAVTEVALEQFDISENMNYIIHYFQPHAPFLTSAGKYNSLPEGGGHSQNVWRGLRDGKFEKDEIWIDYGENLLLVLDEVETLIKNFEGNIVITSDHGNAMGEFGLYGHPFRGAVPSIRRVPWATANTEI